MITTTSTIRFGALVLSLLSLAACLSVAQATNDLEAAVNVASKEAPLIEAAYKVSPSVGAAVNAYFAAVSGCLGAAQTAEAVVGSTPASIALATSQACSVDLLTVPSLGTGVPAEILIGLGLVSGAVSLYLTTVHQATSELKLQHPEIMNSFAGASAVKVYKHLSAKQLGRVQKKLAELKGKLHPIAK